MKDFDSIKIGDYVVIENLYDIDLGEEAGLKQGEKYEVLDKTNTGFYIKTNEDSSNGFYISSDEAKYFKKNDGEEETADDLDKALDNDVFKVGQEVYFNNLDFAKNPFGFSAFRTYKVLRVNTLTKGVIVVNENGRSIYVHEMDLKHLFIDHKNKKNKVSEMSVDESDEISVESSREAYQLIEQLEQENKKRYHELKVDDYLDNNDLEGLERYLKEKEENEK